MHTPWLTVIVVFHDMHREAKRTLHSLTAGYQSGVVGGEYHIIALDHGSTDPIEIPAQSSPAIDYRFIDTDDPSPVRAVNRAVESATTEFVMINIDGARILSPGVIEYARRATRCFSDPFIYTLGWHLGPDLQNVSMMNGYSRESEDRLLDEIDWMHAGYRLFDISVLAGSSAGGFFKPVAESNCFVLRKETWRRLGGYHSGFTSPGGGLANLDLFQRACRHPGVTPVCLLGEGTFHQIHGGVATNVPMDAHPMADFKDEYRRIRGHEYETDTSIRPVYLGRLSDAAAPFARICD